MPRTARPARTTDVAVGDLQPGAVITNLFRHLTVDSVATEEVAGTARTTLAYHYTDDRGLRADESWTTVPSTTVRVLVASL